MRRDENKIVGQKLTDCKNLPSKKIYVDFEPHVFEISGLGIEDFDVWLRFNL